MGYRVYSVDGEQGQVDLAHLRTGSAVAVLTAPSAGVVAMWKAPVACTVTAVRAYRAGGAGAVINAAKNGTDLRSADLSLTSDVTWMGGTASLANAAALAVAAGDSITAEVVSVTNGSDTKALLKFTPASTGTDAFDYVDSKAVVKFTPAAVGGGDEFDYATPQTFTINDGTGATSVTLTGDLTDLAGVVAAVDGILGAGYVVTADTTLVKIEAATAGAKTFVIAGTDAAAITGSAGYVNTAGLTNAITFTLNDGGGAATITLSTDLINLAGVVAAIDAVLDAGYVVTADTTLVKVEAATAGSKTFTVAGTNAAAVTGSAGYVNTAGTSLGPTSVTVQVDYLVSTP